MLSIPKRFAIVGLPGSGKSTFAEHLGKRLHIPVHHLDRHMFEPGGKKRDKQEFMAMQQAFLQEKSWIIEGCSFSTWEMRFSQADTVIYFHLPRWLCLWRLCKRLFNYKPAYGGLRVITWELVRYIWTFDKEKRLRFETLKQRYPQTQFLVFRRPKDVSKYLASMSA